MTYNPDEPMEHSNGHAWASRNVDAMPPWGDLIRVLGRIAAALEKQPVMKQPSEKRQAEVLEPASDEDMDGKFGDPGIRYGLKEKYWKAQPDQYIGQTFSQCSPKYLRATARYKMAVAFMAEKEGTADSLKKARYARLDASRAEGWARRIESGWKTQGEAQDEEQGYRGSDGMFADDDEKLPF